jgi:hypothetical protein
LSSGSGCCRFRGVSISAIFSRKLSPNFTVRGKV